MSSPKRNKSSSWRRTLRLRSLRDYKRGKYPPLRACPDLVLILHSAASTVSLVLGYFRTIDRDRRGLKFSVQTYRCFFAGMVLMDREAMVKLKLVLLAAQTPAQLAAIIIDYTHEEMMLVFRELEWEQQAKIKDIWHTVN